MAGAHPRRGADAHVPHRGDLLDLDNPKRILGRLRQQLLSPAPDEQDGYVPKVFYSCDALVHAETMVLTYGIGDAAIRCRDGVAARTT